MRRDPEIGGGQGPELTIPRLPFAPGVWSVPGDRGDHVFHSPLPRMGASHAASSCRAELLVGTDLERCRRIRVPDSRAASYCTAELLWSVPSSVISLCSSCGSVFASWLMIPVNFVVEDYWSFSALSRSSRIGVPNPSFTAYAATIAGIPAIASVVGGFARIAGTPWPRVLFAVATTLCTQSMQPLMLLAPAQLSEGAAFPFMEQFR